MVGIGGGTPQCNQGNKGTPNPPVGVGAYNKPPPPPQGVGVGAHHPPPPQGGVAQVPPPFEVVPPFIGGNFPAGNIPGGYGFGYGKVPQVPQQAPTMMLWAARYGPLALPA